MAAINRSISQDSGLAGRGDAFRDTFARALRELELEKGGVRRINVPRLTAFSNCGLAN